MTTVLQARPRQFVSTPAVERVALRALRYLQSGFSVHLRGPAGTGKTTLAMHLADLLSRPIMLIFGDDEFKTSDLIGAQSGYTRKKVVDNFIHSVVKVEDELRHNWVDSRLTLACREGFTLVYDEFNRSRPEVNNVLLSALEEKLLVLPPSGNRSEYIRVNPHFRAIFTSNPEEYCGVHDTQDALMDRLVTINIPEPDELTQQEILVQKTGIDRAEALYIVRLVRQFRMRTKSEKSSGLRASLMLAKVCHEHSVTAMSENAEFREICGDVLLSRTSLPFGEATTTLWHLLNEFVGGEVTDLLAQEDRHLALEPTTVEPSKTEALVAHPDDLELPSLTALVEPADTSDESLAATDPLSVEDLPVVTEPASLEATDELLAAITEPTSLEAADELLAATAPEDVENLAEAAVEPLEILIAPEDSVADLEREVLAAKLESDSTAVPVVLSHEQEVYDYLQQSQGARISEIEVALGINRVQTVNALRSLTEKGVLSMQRDGSAPHSTYRIYAN